MRGRTERICQFCGTVYYRKEHFERHVRTHTRERPFCCTQCGSSFARRDTWRRHMRACHSAPDSLPSALRTTRSSLRRDEPSETVVASPIFVDPPGGSPIVSSLSLGLDSLFTPASGNFDWQWDDALDLDPSFSMEDLGTYDLHRASPSLPLLPLRPPGESRDERGPSASTRPYSDMSEPWFTGLLCNMQSSRQFASLTAASATGIDEGFSRDALANSLQQRVPDTTLPPTAFLNRCVHTFTTRLWPLIPIVHLPTFRPAQTNPLLLLSICSLGALADGSKDALYHAERLFEGVHKAILVSSSPSKVAAEHTLAVLQAAAIGQTFALLSGNPSHLLTAQLYHGTLSVAVRKFKDVVFGSDPPSSSTPSSPSSEQDWHQWILSQSIIRLLNAVYIHNGEISAIFHEPASLRSNPFQIQTAAPDNLFLAKTVDEWASINTQYSTSSASPHAIFSSCAIIEGFVAEVGHCKAVSFNGENRHSTEALESSLSKWFRDSVEYLATDGANRLSLLLLCHSCFMMLLCEINVMERVYGRDSPNILEAEWRSLQDWALTREARRCVAHAVLIYKLLERARVSDTPAIHVARTSWQAGLVLAAYSFFAHGDDASGFKDLPESYAELRAARMAGFYAEGDWATFDRGMGPERCKAFAFSLATTLRNLGPWQNAARYAETLDWVLNLLETDMNS